ncbi:MULTISPECIES: ParA family protein [Fusobacterium]|uniref:ATPase n=1 Tax=Fusobacterium animalis TaxID=76859 RepID=A0A0M4RWS2_9FUSO|nr:MULTISPECIES: ParA family protein [Fusobacterium]ALF17358.1 ATPase [Fusobacterium animalis]
MGKIIQIKVQKGGLGKSFITATLGHLLAIMENKVLILSTDSQNSIYDIFTKEKKAKVGNKGLIDSILNSNLNTIELREKLEFIPLEMGKRFTSRILEKIPSFLKSLKTKYDYILIDSTPSLELDEIFLKNSDQIIVPAIGDKLAVNGIINIIKQNPEKIAAIVFNRYTNTRVNKAYYKEMKELCDNSGVFMPEPIKLLSYIAELVERGETIWEVNSKKVVETQEVFKEILKRIY